MPDNPNTTSVVLPCENARTLSEILQYNDMSDALRDWMHAFSLSVALEQALQRIEQVEQYRDGEAKTLPQCQAAVVQSKKALGAYWQARELPDPSMATQPPAAEGKLRTALADLVLDLEQRSNMKPGKDCGVVDCGSGVYVRAKSALAQPASGGETS